jgi:hypothetical protein
MSEPAPATPADVRNMTAAEATAHLASMKQAYDARTAPSDPSPTQKLADPGFREKYLAGDASARAEIKSLIEGKTAADAVAAKVDAALAGSPPSGFYVNSPDGVSPADLGSAVNGFRGIGVSDGALRECFTGNPTDRETYDAVMAYRQSMLEDPEWKARWLKGDVRARRELFLCNTVKLNFEREAASAQRDYAKAVAAAAALAAK